MILLQYRANGNKDAYEITCITKKQYNTLTRLTKKMFFQKMPFDLAKICNTMIFEQQGSNYLFVNSVKNKSFN